MKFKCSASGKLPQKITNVTSAILRGTLTWMTCGSPCQRFLMTIGSKGYIRLLRKNLGLYLQNWKYYNRIDNHPIGLRLN